MSATRAAKPLTDPVALARRTLLEGVGAEVAGELPGHHTPRRADRRRALPGRGRALDGRAVGRARAQQEQHLREPARARGRGDRRAPPRGGRAPRPLPSARQVPRRGHRRVHRAPAPRRLRQAQPRAALARDPRRRADARGHGPPAEARRPRAGPTTASPSCSRCSRRWTARSTSRRSSTGFAAALGCSIAALVVARCAAQGRWALRGAPLSRTRWPVEASARRSSSR